MNRFLLLVIALVFSVKPGMCQQAIDRENDSKQIYAPLHSVPEWVKGQVSPAEYELWQRLSRYYRVDYSILEQELSPERKTEIYGAIRETLDRIDRGILPQGQCSYYTFSILPQMETDLQWNICHLTRIDEHLYFINKQAPIYQSVQNEKIQVVCSIWYTYDILRKKADVIQYAFKTLGDCSSFQGVMGVVEFLSESDVLQGSCSGSLTSQDQSKNYHTEHFNARFLCPPSLAFD